MKNRIWVFLSVLLVISTVMLFGCTANRRPDTTTPDRNRTTPSPTRVTPPVTPSPTRVTPPSTTDPGTSGPRVPRTPTPATPDTAAPGRTSSDTNTPGTMRRPSTANTAGDKAKDIARDIAKEKNIESASCVVTGDTALVGLQFEEQYKGKVTDAIKKSVEKRVKKIEPSIKNVAVTADPDLLSRIKTMAKDIEGGKPLSGFTKEIDEIIRRINPF
ncbi:MAG: YhcN/YlaJ family sporulation lipoprotein [Caldicoprobacterales bacterium]